MSIGTFLLTLSLLGILLALGALLIVAWLLYHLVGLFTKNPHSKLWGSVLITAIALCILPDPADLLTGGFPGLELIMAAIAGYKLTKGGRK